MVGSVILLVSFPLAFLGAVLVRRDDAERWHMWLYMVATGFVAFGIGWVSGFGLLGLIFFPMGVLVAWADTYFKILYWLDSF